MSLLTKKIMLRLVNIPAMCCCESRFSFTSFQRRWKGTNFDQQTVSKSFNKMYARKEKKYIENIARVKIKKQPTQIKKLSVNQSMMSNSMMLTKVQEVLGSGDVGELLMDVELTACFMNSSQSCSITFKSTNTHQRNLEIYQMLLSAQRYVRHILIQSHSMGKVPIIRFVLENENQVTVENIFEEHHEMFESLKSKDLDDEREDITNEDVMLNIYGLDRDKMISKIYKQNKTNPVEKQETSID